MAAEADGKREGVAMVLAGGGARGAYEAGALSVLLPAMEKEGTLPTVFIGSSTGAINAVGLASTIHLRAEAASVKVLELWREATFKSTVRRARLGSGGLLDPSPLIHMLDTKINWEQLHANIRPGCLSAVGLVATSYTTLVSTVFLECLADLKVPPRDEPRGIDYLPSTLSSSHVRASSAIPVAFAAAPLDRAPGLPDWYADGGVRLNTPLKPAVELRVKRILVVSTSPAGRPLYPAVPPPRPALGGAAALLAYAVLDDRLVEDLRTLAARNKDPSAKKADGVGPSDEIEYLFAGPPADDPRPLGRLVTEALGRRSSLRRHPRLVRRLVRRRIGRVLSKDLNRAELASHLCFDPDFIAAAIALGQRHAEASLDSTGTPIWKTEEPG